MRRPCRSYRFRQSLKEKKDTMKKEKKKKDATERKHEDKCYEAKVKAEIARSGSEGPLGVDTVNIF